MDARSLPSGLGSREVRDALSRAAATWNAPACTAARIDVRVANNALVGGQRDGQNTIVFHRRNFCRAGVLRAGACYDKRMSATTTVNLGAEIPKIGEIAIKEIDIELNAVDFLWTVGSSRTLPSGNVMDLQTVLTHELGHALGLAHVCVHGDQKPRHRDAHGNSILRCADANAAVRASVMVPAGDIPFDLPIPIKHELGADDLRAICAIYPAAPVEIRDVHSDVGCGCRTVRSRGGRLRFWCLAGLFGVLVWRGRRRPGLATMSVGDRRARDARLPFLTM